MYKKHITIAALLLSVKILALSCSTPITISDSRYKVKFSDVCANIKGDVAVSWISVGPRKNAVMITYKTQNSSWSSPEIISRWEEYIDDNKCFVSSKGDLFATWKANRDDSCLTQIVEKIEGGSWSHPLDWVSNNISGDFSTSNFWYSGVGFDTCGKLIFSGRTDKKRIPSISLLIKSPAELEQSWDTFKIKDLNYLFTDLSIAMNKKGDGYVFWTSQESEGDALMCRKIQNSRFSLDPETILYGQEHIFGPIGVFNENGNVIIAYEDTKGNGKIITKFNDSWSEPLLFTTRKEDPSKIEVSIDDAGNVMAGSIVTIDQADYLKTIYKPFGQSWKELELFSLSQSDGWMYPEIRPDGNGNFVAIWENEISKHHSIFGATFSTMTQTWSEPQLLSPKGKSCFDYSYVFWAPGKGYICWITDLNGFHDYVQVAELSNEE